MEIILKPHPSKIYLVLEVANTSLAFDRAKSKVYAKGEISEYIIFNLIDKTLEVYKNPKNHIYTEMKIYSENEIFYSIVLEEISFKYSDFA
jgi:hypothetical protein